MFKESPLWLNLVYRLRWVASKRLDDFCPRSSDVNPVVASSAKSDYAPIAMLVGKAMHDVRRMPVRFCRILKVRYRITCKAVCATLQYYELRFGIINKLFDPVEFRNESLVITSGFHGDI
jgi:hypothetical protein